MSLFSYQGQSDTSTIKTVSASEAKNSFGKLSQWVVKNQSDVIVEKMGEPKVAIVDIEHYKKLLNFRKQQKRQTAISRLRKLRKQVQERTGGMTEKQAMKLADEFSKEVVEEMEQEGKVKFS